MYIPLYMSQYLSMHVSVFMATFSVLQVAAVGRSGRRYHRPSNHQNGGNAPNILMAELCRRAKCIQVQVYSEL